MNNRSTIIAVATPIGLGAISVLRVSGAETFTLTQMLLRQKQLSDIADRQAVVAHIYDNNSNNSNPIDEVIITKFTAPHSFTGEDVIEIACHGNPLICKQIIAAYLAIGAETAPAGAFSQRAFEEGKLDLTQAESIMQIIHAESEVALRYAQQQLQGNFKQLIERLRGELIAVIAQLEAYIDFPDEPLEIAIQQELTIGIQRVMASCQQLVASEKNARLVRHGIAAVLCGKPNAGKSSVLNYLLGIERAIVSSEAGTTRDSIEESINIAGLQMRLIDTAGIRHSDDHIEQQGVERAEALMQQADLIIEVIDGSLAQPDFIVDSKHELAAKTIYLVNKSDLGLAPYWQMTTEHFIACSCTKQIGKEKLLQYIIELLSLQKIAQGSSQIAINERHKRILQQTLQALTNAKHLFEQQADIDLIAVDLREAFFLLGTISGIVSDIENVLDEIFSTFCIGK